jgi:D-3-phosphoglycerate dehydrogenase
VNVAGGVIDPSVRPGIPLMEKLGQVFSGLAHSSPVTSVEVEVRGEIAEHDVKVLKLAALKGIFTNVVSESVSYVNAPLLAEQRGIEVRLTVEPESPDFRNLLSIRGALSEVDVPIDDHLIIMQYTDRPGIVAVYGKEFGDARINIAGMQIARDKQGGKALSVLTVDSPVPATLLEKVRTAIEADVMLEIDITE